MTPQTFLTHLIAYLVGALSIVLWQLFVRGYVYAFFYNAGILLGAVGYLVCQLWIDVAGLFRKKKKVVKLDEYEEKAFHRSRL